MATGNSTTSTPCVVGPVPYKDIADADGSARPQEEKVAVAAPNDMRLYQGTWVPERFVPGIVAVQAQRGFAARPGDVLLASPPKCGTTWLQALAFAVMARGAACPPAAEGHPLLRLNPHDCVPHMERVLAEGWGSRLDALPSPRLMATHMHHSLLPASITDCCKIIYICREPKDMVVSSWHFWRSIFPDIPFSDMFKAVCEGSCYSGPIWDHNLGYWNASKANLEKVLFLRYEDLLQDPASNVSKLARFIGQPFSPAEEEAGVVHDVVKLCSFEKLKNLEVNKTGSCYPFLNQVFFRKGNVGDWENHMTTEMAERLDAIFREKLQGSGLVFS